MARRIPTKDKWKAKSWYTIMAPENFGEKEVGETPAEDPAMVVGRRVEVNARDLAEGRKLNQTKLVLEVAEVAGDKARTKLAGYEISRSYMRSLVRRGRRRVDLIKNLDVGGRKLRLKVAALTLTGCQSSQEKDIRRVMDEEVGEFVKDKELQEFVDAVLNRELQDAIQEKTTKIFPVSGVEVRKIKFLN